MGDWICTMTEKYNVKAKEPAYAAENGNHTGETRCFKWFRGPDNTAKLGIPICQICLVGQGSFFIPKHYKQTSKAMHWFWSVEMSPHSIRSHLPECQCELTRSYGKKREHEECHNKANTGRGPGRLDWTGSDQILIISTQTRSGTR